MTFGSVPIMQYGVGPVPDSDLQGKDYWCEDSFRLLKEHGAPVIWLDECACEDPVHDLDP